MGVFGGGGGGGGGGWILTSSQLDRVTSGRPDTVVNECTLKRFSHI